MQVPIVNHPDYVAKINKIWYSQKFSYTKGMFDENNAKLSLIKIY